MPVYAWSPTASSNTGILSGLTLDGSVMTVPQVDNAFRQIAADIATQGIHKLGYMGATKASAATVDLSTATGWHINISGSVTITSFGIAPAGALYMLCFTGILTLTHSSSIILPGGVSITTAVGDCAFMMSLGAGAWRCLSYQRVNGNSVAATTSSMSVGTSTAASSFNLVRPITTGMMIIDGGTSVSTGSYLQLFGSTHSTNANDIALGSIGAARYLFDYSANTHYWYNNTPTIILTLGPTGNVTLAGDLTVSGANITCNSYQGTGTSAFLGTTTAGIVHLRPNGIGSAAGQTMINSAGEMTVADKVISNANYFTGGTIGTSTVLTNPVGSTQSIFLRPTGSTTGQTSIDNAGVMNVAAPYSSTGAVNGLTISAGSIYQSKTVSTVANQHVFYNPNGLVGSIQTTGTTTAYNISSDERLKENFRSFDSGMLVDAINVYQFDWIMDGKLGYGVKAQECFEVFPNAIAEGGEDPRTEPWSADYSKFVPLLLAEVKVLRARVAALETHS